MVKISCSSNTGLEHLHH